MVYDDNNLNSVEKPLFQLVTQPIEPTTKREDKFNIRKSSIAGKGIFAKTRLRKHDLIGQAFTKTSSIAIPDINYKGTTLGKMVNHSDKPNLYLRTNHEGSIFYYTKRCIRQNEELLIDYNDFPFDGIRDHFKKINTSR